MAPAVSSRLREQLFLLPPVAVFASVALYAARELKDSRQNAYLSP